MKGALTARLKQNIQRSQFSALQLELILPPITWPLGTMFGVGKNENEGPCILKPVYLEFI